jgi:hypothetical protein
MQASFITQTQYFPEINQSEEVPYSTTLNFNKFNPSVGILNSISMTVDTEFQVSVSIINLTPFSQQVTLATAMIPITIAGPNANFTLPVSAGPFSEVVPSYFITGNIYSYDGVPLTTHNSFGVPISPSYIGAGTIPFTYNLNDGVGTYGGSAYSWVFFGGKANANGSVVLTYDYTPVPEPSTYIAGLGALCLFGFTAFPRKK